MVAVGMRVGVGIGRTRVNAALMRMLAAFGAVNIAEWGFVTALSIEAYRRDGTLAVGLIGLRLIAGALSSALLAPALDTRRAVLPAIAAIRALLLSVAAALVLAGAGLVPVFALVILDSIAAGPYRPAQSRLLPALARSPAELTMAAAGVSMVKTLGQAAGALTAGIAVALSSPGATMAGAAWVMVFAALLSAPLTARTVIHADRWGGVRAGLRAFPAVLRDPSASPLVLASITRTLVRGLWGALLVVVALRLLALGSSGVGLLQAAAGVGAALAVPITASLVGRERLGAPCALAFLAAGLTVSAVGLLPYDATAYVLICGWGMAMAVADAASLSLLHRAQDARTLGRTVGVMEALKLSAEGIGALLAPALVALLGLRPALVVAGLPLPLIVLGSWRRIHAADAAAEQRGRLVGLLHGLRAFRGSDMASIEQIAASVIPVQAPPGSEVIVQGTAGDRFYAIESGEAEIVVGGYPIARIGPGAGFGERALIRDAPRAATVRALTPLRLHALERSSFLAALTGFTTVHPDARPDYQYDLAATPVPELLTGIRLLSRLGPAAIDRLAAASQLQQWPAGDVVVREGERGQDIYVVISGRAQVTVAAAVTNELLSGDSFGEIGLLHTRVRTATVTALEPLTTLALPGDAVRRELGGSAELKPAVQENELVLDQPA